MRRVLVGGFTSLLIAVLSCGHEDEGPIGPGGPEAPTTGGVLVSLLMSGSDLDADGCDLNVDSGPSQRVGPGTTVVFYDLSPGAHVVAIEGVAANCQADGGTSRSVAVVAGQTTQVTFTIVCDWRSRIAFARSHDIYVMNPDGTEEVGLTGGGEDSDPVWSPDGSKIAYELGWVCSKDDTYCTEIWVVNADGTGQTQLTDGTESVFSSPVWSPDGRRIAFWKGGPGSFGGADVWVMNADGTDQINLTNSWEPDLFPTWSPDGSRIAFVCRNNEIYQICSMNADGREVVQLTDRPLDDLGDGQPARASPTWSPDGTRIAFHAGGAVHLMNPDGTRQVSLASGYSPTWSPDGSRIAFVRDGGIYVMNSDGSAQAQVTDHPDKDGDPKWSPDGTRILFGRRYLCSSSFALCGDIFVIEANGTREQRLTNHMGDYRQSARDAVWSPDLY